MKRYIYLWLKLAINAAQETYVNRFSNVLFFIGKIIRFSLFLILLFSFQNNIGTVGPYQSSDLIIFFLIFNWIDTTTQMLYRGVYLFQQQVRRGEFDFDLIRPISPLFKALFGKPDINDAIFLIPITGVSVYILQDTLLSVTSWQWLTFGVLFMNGMLIATAFHILVLSLGIVSQEVDNTIMLFRDLTHFARFPIDIYRETTRFILTFIVPVGIMLTLPAQALRNQDLLVTVPVGLLVGVTFFMLSLIVWKYALRQYSSASS